MHKIKIMGTTVLLVGVAACGGSPTQPASAPATSTPATTTPSSTTPPVGEPTAPTATKPGEDDALRVAVQAYSDAFLMGNGRTAYAILSKRCKARTSADTFDGIAARAKAAYGNGLPFKSYRDKVSGDFARVTYTYAISAIDQTDEPWTREGGIWRQDDC